MKFTVEQLYPEVLELQRDHLSYMTPDNRKSILKGFHSKIFSVMVMVAFTPFVYLNFYPLPQSLALPVIALFAGLALARASALASVSAVVWLSVAGMATVAGSVLPETPGIWVMVAAAIFNLGLGVSIPCFWADREILKSEQADRATPDD